MPCSFFLVGPMGAGKTTIGKILSQKINYSFVDSDTEIERLTGVSIPVIFELEGENGFREREAQIIDQLSQKKNVILSTGGGVVLRQESRTFLKMRGTVIYLKISPNEQFKRIKGDKNRPLIQKENPYQILCDLQREREPYYLAAANYVVFCDNIERDLLVEGILNRIILKNTDKYYSWIKEINENITC